jgi:hypothetical protein
VTGPGPPASRNTHHREFLPPQSCSGPWTSLPGPTTIKEESLSGTAWAEPLSVKAVGEQAVTQWEGQATFIPGPDGKPKLLDNLVWRLIGGTGSAEGISGTGSAEGIRGAGIMHIRAVSPREREFSLERSRIRVAL